MKLFGGVYNGCRVLLTGHTGFKGSWLALWLREMGAEVTGVALDPSTTSSHWSMLGVEVDDRRLDVRDTEAVSAVMAEAQPGIVFHLAAQPLVRRSYVDPLLTWGTNVMGTGNVLDACRKVSSVKAIVVVTTDKCYENREWRWGYREVDRLGGHDPYSASKAATELLSASYRKSFLSNEDSAWLATARAGNVIGGGDWSEDRLIPDLVRALSLSKSLDIRSPMATRPWQHVLESLSGYLLLGQKLLERNQPAFADAWNFGPDDSGNMSVEQVLELMREEWDDLRWHVSETPQPHEAHLLQLDSTKARHDLCWLPVWSLPEGLKRTAAWYREYLLDGKHISREQLADYIETAAAKGLVWVD